MKYSDFFSFFIVVIYCLIHYFPLYEDMVYSLWWKLC